MSARERLEALVASLGLAPAPGPLDQVVRYADLLQKWGARINLAGSTRWQTLGPLFEEALWAASRYPSGPILHLDIGSGGGFPALPLRIFRPEMTLVMVEPRLKRAVFLEAVVRELDLARSEVHVLRVEDFLARDARQWDIVSWKALRLEGEALDRIDARMACDGKLWIFHGRELPVADARFESGHELVSCEPIPKRKEAFLSIYGLLHGKQ